MTEELSLSAVSKEPSLRKPRLLWSDEDEEKLILLWEQKETVRQIQEKIFPDRSVSSIVAKISNLRYAGKVGHHYSGYDFSNETNKDTLGSVSNLQVFLNTKEIIYSRFMVREIDGATVAVLKESIKLYGLLQPIVVFKNERGQYEVICGNHRLCAAKGIGLSEVPVIIKSSVSNTDAIFLSLAENVQRLEMNPLKEGEIYLHLLKDGYDIDGLVQKIGRSKYYIETRIKVFQKLHEELRGQIGKRLTIGNAIALSGLPKARQMEIYETLIQNIGPKSFFATRAKGVSEVSKGANYRKDKPSIIYCVCERCGAKHLHGVSLNDPNVA